MHHPSAINWRFMVRLDPFSIRVLNGNKTNDIPSKTLVWGCRVSFLFTNITKNRAHSVCPQPKRTTTINLPQPGGTNKFGFPIYFTGLSEVGNQLAQPLFPLFYKTPHTFVYFFL